MSEKKYGKCSECGAPCEVVTKMDYDGFTPTMPYNEFKYHPQPGAGWVKATIIRPEGWQLARLIDSKKRFPVRFSLNVIADVAGKTYEPRELEYLSDESPAEQPVADNARYELKLALRDMIKLAKHIGCSITNYNQFEQRIESAEAMLKKHSNVTDILRTEAAEQPVADELKQLRQWKKEATLIINPIMEYAQGHKDAKLGSSLTDFVIDRCKELDRIKAAEQPGREESK